MGQQVAQLHVRYTMMMNKLTGKFCLGSTSNKLQTSVCEVLVLHVVKKNFSFVVK